MLLICLVLGAVSVSCVNGIVSAEDSKDLFLFKPWIDGLEVNINFAIYTPCSNMYWDWGDSSESDGFSGTHLYSKSGTYIVTVTLDTKEKGKISEKIEVTVDATKSAEDLEEPNNLHRLTLFSPEVSGLRVTINGVVVAPVKRIEWDWGDGQRTASWFPANHTYLHSGTYTVKVIAYDKKGRTTTKEVKVTLSPTSERSKNKIFKNAGLVAEWHFDEGSGNIVKDSSGNGNDGIIYGATFVDGISGYALNFDGIDDYVDTSLLPPTVDLERTIVLWAKTTSTKNMEAVSYGGGHSGFGNSFRCAFNLGGSEGVTIDTSNGAITYDATVADGNWHYYAWVVPNIHTPTVNDGEIYKDAILQTKIKTEISSNTKINTEARERLEIGRYWDEYRYFEGKIDEVMIYNRALSAEEISTLYNKYMKKKENQEIASKLINSVSTKIDALKRKNVGTSLIEQALSKAKDSYELEKYDEAYELAQNAQKMADDAYETAGYIESAQSEIDEAKSIGADVTDAESKLNDARDALDKGNYEYARLWTEEASELAKHASVGSVKIIDLKALATKYDQRTVVVSGTIRDIETVYGKGYTFALDDGTGMISVVYEGGLGDIQEGDKVMVSGAFQASTGTVAAETVQKSGVGGVPGFEAIFAIAGLLTVAYLIRRRKEG